MEKQINFKNIRLINLKFLFRRFSFAICTCIENMHSELWYYHDIARPVDEQSLQGKKCVRNWRQLKQILIINKRKRKLRIVTFECYSIFYSCCTGYNIMWKFTFWAKHVQLGSEKIKKNRAVMHAAASKNILKSIISLQSSGNMTSQHFGDPFDTKTLPTLMKNTPPVNWNTAQNHQTQNVAKR